MFYPKIPHLGSIKCKIKPDDDVMVTEKIDGSFFCAWKETGSLRFFNKNIEIFPGTCDKIYNPTIEYIQSIEEYLYPNIRLYGEALRAPRHNALKYDRAPQGHLVLFATEQPTALTRPVLGDAVIAWAIELQVDCVRPIYRGKFKDLNLEEILKSESLLGGQIEGVIISVTNSDDSYRSLICQSKLVREEYLEIKRRPKTKMLGTDTWSEFKELFRTEARWQKAWQHLREDGELAHDRTDIGKLMKSVHLDIEEEEREYITQWLYKHFGTELKKNAVKGLVEWYDQKLMEDKE